MEKKAPKQLSRPKRRTLAATRWSPNPFKKKAALPPSPLPGETLVYQRSETIQVEITRHKADHEHAGQGSDNKDSLKNLTENGQKGPFTELASLKKFMITGAIALLIIAIISFAAHEIAIRNLQSGEIATGSPAHQTFCGILRFEKFLENVLPFNVDLILKEARCGAPHIQ